VSSKRPYAAWYEGDYRKKTGWFTDPDQDAIYRGLLADYGINGPLTDDDDELRALCRNMPPDRWQRWWPKIKSRFFHLEDDGKLHNKRADEEWERVRTRGEEDPTAQYKNAGGVGGRVRWAKERALKDARDLEEPLRGAVVEYAALAARLQLQPLQVITPDRQAKLTACLTGAGGIEGWRTALEKIGANGFLRGEGKRGWKPDFDWIIDPKNFAKLMEGYYERHERDAGKPAAAATDDGGYEELRRAAHAAVTDTVDPLDKFAH
jgi:uncharacterized protein YdaU (DUF1376 family)